MPGASEKVVWESSPWRMSKWHGWSAVESALCKAKFDAREVEAMLDTDAAGPTDVHDFFAQVIEDLCDANKELAKLMGDVQASESYLYGRSAWATAAAIEETEPEVRKEEIPHVHRFDLSDRPHWRNFISYEDDDALHAGLHSAISSVKEDGTVDLLIEMPTRDGIGSAICNLPTAIWRKVDGFDSEELFIAERFVRKHGEEALEMAATSGCDDGAYVSPTTPM